MSGPPVPYQWLYRGVRVHGGVRVWKRGQVSLQPRLQVITSASHWSVTVYSRLLLVDAGRGSTDHQYIIMNQQETQSQRGVGILKRVKH